MATENQDSFTSPVGACHANYIRDPQTNEIVLGAGPDSAPADLSQTKLCVAATPGTPFFETVLISPSDPSFHKRLKFVAGDPTPPGTPGSTVVDVSHDGGSTWSEKFSETDDNL